jgi:hypothetical protein
LPCEIIKLAGNSFIMGGITAGFFYGGFPTRGWVFKICALWTGLH